MTKVTQLSSPQTQTSAKSSSSLSVDAPVPAFLAGQINQAQSLSPDQVRYLQRTAGNRAVAQLLNRQSPTVQAKLTVGPVGDRYEQEADRIAAQVVNGPAPIQRHDDEEVSAGHVQRSPLAAQITPLVQRHHAIRKNEPLEDEPEEEEAEESLQRSPLPTLQRNYPHGRAHPNSIGKSPDEMNASKALQRKASDDTAFDPGSDFTRDACRANRGRGRPLADSLRANMETSFGASSSKSASIPAPKQCR